MKINTLKIKNFKMFENLNIHFNPKFSLIIGTNGAGKTSILEAISISLGAYLSGFDGVKPRNIYTDDIRRDWERTGDATVLKEPRIPVVIEAVGEIDGRQVEWSRTRSKVTNGRTSRTGAKEVIAIAENYQRKLREKDKDLTLPVISYQGAGRLFSQKKDKWLNPFNKDETSRLVGYVDCLEAESNIKLFVSWLRKMTGIQFQKRKPIGELDAVLNAVNKFMTLLSDNNESSQLYFDFEEQEVVIERNTRTDTLRSMSAGYRSVIGMVADIAYRMSVLNPHLREEAVTETTGIVLIDEIDLHLHPQWQWRIIKALNETFPLVQFIATTHAPIVISSFNAGGIINLQQIEGEVESHSAPYGWLVEDVLTEVMDTFSRDPAVSSDIDLIEKLYSKKLQNQLSSDEKLTLIKTTEKLYKILPEGDPAVTLSKIHAVGKASSKEYDHD